MSLSLYLHYPFCRNRCSYCDFYKELHDPELERQFYRALMVETELALMRLPTDLRQIDTIFIGGGTPSLTNVELLGKWLDRVRESFTISDHLEFSIETNPESVGRELLSALKEFGVNRPLFGIQSFNTELLKILSRTHNPHDSHRAVYLARALGFDNFGVDLIFGLPIQTGQLLVDDINQIIDLAPPHISFYQLAVEEGTPLAAEVATGKISPADDDLVAGMYRDGVARFIDVGYERYEVSSFAQPDRHCRHNMVYWQGGSYLGLGPSAHSFIGGQRFSNPQNLGRWVSSLERRELPRIIDDSGIEQRMNEAIMLGLRLAEGISKDAFFERFAVDLEDRIDLKQCELLIKSGHLVCDDAGLRLTDEGFFLADEVTRRLLP